MKNTWKVALALLLVCFLITGVFAATASPGTEGDPLVTLGYLQNIFRPQVLQEAEDAAESMKADLEDSLNDIIDERLSGVTPSADPDPSPSATTPASPDESVFSVVTLSNGQILTGDVGCEIMLRIGTATCVSDGTPGLIDVTDGTTLNNGDSLQANHLCMVTISTRSVRATATVVKLLVRGPYTVT